MNSAIPPNASVLNSWKEIAQHVGRGVRTVQRWERDLGMPVRRPRAKSRSAVIALTEEIDAWLRSAPTTELMPERLIERSEAIKEIQGAIKDHLELRDRCNKLRAANHTALQILIGQLKQMHQSVADSRDLRNALEVERERTTNHLDGLIQQHD